MTLKGVDIAVDFDGTCVEHEFPRLGADVPNAVDALKYLVSNGARIILYTMRSGEDLDEAVGWFQKRDIPLYGIQTNPHQSKWTDSPKCDARFCIDDRNIGTPLIYPQSSGWSHELRRPYVDWEKVVDELEKRVSRV